MNSRIRELWEQCKTYDWNLNRPTYTYDHEKFAELIIKECIEISQVGSITENKLKEHFGVEQ